MILHEVNGFLGERRRADVLRLLNSPDLEWERPDRLGRTTSGRMWQLASPDMHHRPEMIQLSTLMASVVYDEIQRARPGLLPDPSEAVPQVFPVRMEGNTDEPPTQLAHKDEARGQHPCVTALYYAEVENVVGGALALHHRVRRRAHLGGPRGRSTGRNSWRPDSLGRTAHRRIQNYGSHEFLHG